MQTNSLQPDDKWQSLLSKVREAIRVVVQADIAQIVACYQEAAKSQTDDDNDDLVGKYGCDDDDGQTFGPNLKVLFGL